MPLFSIIIPVYNVQNYLSACVKSVVEQPGPRDWECILVDDGSTDQSVAMCDAFAAEALSAAYRTPVTLDADNRLMGRTAAIFQDFEGMMNTPADKQRAWALLKKLR